MRGGRSRRLVTIAVDADELTELTEDWCWKWAKPLAKDSQNCGKSPHVCACVPSSVCPPYPRAYVADFQIIINGQH